MNGETKQPFDKPRGLARVGFWLEGSIFLKEVYKGFIPVFVYYLIKPSSSEWWMWMGFTIVTFIGFFIGWLIYRKIRFHIDTQKGEFIYESGVLSKKHIAMQLDRIQQVNISQHLMQRLLNVYKVEISTAGSEKTEVVLRALTASDARELRRRLMIYNQEEKPVEKGTDETVAHHETELSTNREILQLSNSTIFKIALTSRYMRSLGILIAFWAAVYNNIKNIFKLNPGGEEDVPELTVIKFLIHSTVGIILAFVLLWIIFNILNGFLKFYDYKIRFTSRALQVSFGSIKKNQIIVRKEKVQVVEMVTNYFQRKMNLSRLIFQQASSDFERDKKAIVEVPGVSADEREDAVSHILGTLPEKFETILLPNYRKLFQLIPKLILLPLAIVLIFSIPIPFFPYWLAAWILLIGLLSYFRYRHSKMMISNGFIMVQEGVFDISQIIMEPYKIQGVQVTQRLWHRRAGIAHITILTAASNLVFKYVKLSEVNPFLNKWLYDSESTDKNWM